MVKGVLGVFLSFCCIGGVFESLIVLLKVE